MQVYDLSSRVYIITGAGGGIGSVLAEHLYHCGAKLVLGGRDQEKLHRIAEKTGGIALPFEGSDFASAERLAAAATEHFGRIDGAACCSGSVILKPAHLTTQKEFEDTIAANASAAFGLVRAVAKPRMENGGSIVLFASASSVT